MKVFKISQFIYLYSLLNLIHSIVKLWDKVIFRIFLLIFTFISICMYTFMTSHLSFFSPLARTLFNVKDDALLRHQYEDNQKIEPEMYIPIIPMVLVNGAEGIGTGWSTKVPNYDIREVVNNLRRMIDGEDVLPMVSVQLSVIQVATHLEIRGIQGN